MKKLGITLLAVLLMGTFGMAKTNYFDNIVVDGTTTMTGAVTFAGDVGITGNLIVDGTLVALDGATSVRNISAGFTSAESPANRFGVNATVYMSIATTATTGITAITHTGSAPAVTWTADSLSFVGDFDSNGATAVLDGSTSVRLLSAGFTSSESPANRLGLNATEYMQIATTITTGITAITHTGSAPAVTWTADSLSFVGDFDSNGATALLDGSTSARLVSAGFVSVETSASDFRIGFDAATYMKVAVANTTGNVTITHVNGSTDLVTWTAAGGFDFVGAMAVDTVTGSSTIEATAFVIDDGDADLTVDSDNQTHGSATILVPDFVDATADFLVTNLYTTDLPFMIGLAGEDTDGAGTNGGGMAGSTVDLTTHDYNDGAGATADVHAVCKDATDGATYVDLKTASSLTAWTNNYQLQPDAASEAAGDAFAIGFDEKFVEVVFNDLSTNNGQLATYGGDAGKWQYSTGAGTWSDLTVFDNTDSTAGDGLRTLQRTGAITFADPGAGWVTATYDGEVAYWIQWVVTAEQLTQPAIIDDTNFDEPIVAIPTTDSFQAPYKLEIVDVRVTDMGITVHDAAIKFVVGNFTDGIFSAELTWTASQFNDKYTLAAALAADAGDIIGILITDDAGSSVNPVWAIEFEVTYED